MSDHFTLGAAMTERLHCALGAPLGGFSEAGTGMSLPLCTDYTGPSAQRFNDGLRARWEGWIADAGLVGAQLRHASDHDGSSVRLDVSMPDAAGMEAWLGAMEGPGRDTLRLLMRDTLLSFEPKALLGEALSPFSFRPAFSKDHETMLREKTIAYGLVQEGMDQDSTEALIAHLCAGEANPRRRMAGLDMVRQQTKGKEEVTPTMALDLLADKMPALADHIEKARLDALLSQPARAVLARPAKPTQDVTEMDATAAYLRDQSRKIGTFRQLIDQLAHAAAAPVPDEQASLGLHHLAARFPRLAPAIMLARREGVIGWEDGHDDDVEPQKQQGPMDEPGQGSYTDRIPSRPATMPRPSDFGPGV